MLPLKPPTHTTPLLSNDARASGAPAPFVLALTGNREDVSAALRTLDGELNKESAGVRVAALACPDWVDGADALPEGIDCHPDIESLARALPEPDAILCLTPRHDAPQRLHTLFAPSTAVYDAPGSRFLLALLTSSALARSCRADLAGTRSMLETIIDQLHEDVLLLDANGIIRDCNRNLWRRKECAKADILGRHFAEVLDEEENLCKSPGTPCPFGTTLKTGGKAEAMYTRVDERGRVQYIRVYTYPVFGQSGELIHVAEVRRDITSRTEMEERLKQSEKLAAIGELSTFLAHEIRNPLFSIGGFANALMRERGLTPETREKVSIILQESKRLDDILKNILKFAKPMAGEVGEVDLNRVVDETLPVASMGCSSQHIEVRLEKASALPKAHGQADLVKQCLINLVKNSVEAMPEGGRLAVRTAQSTRHVVVEVEDTGLGIAEEHRELVFSPFFSTKNKGTGLGLAMIKKIIEDMGGEVSLSSRTGSGTSVELKLRPLMAVSEGIGTNVTQLNGDAP